MSEVRNDSDSPWKEVLERYFPEFLRFFFVDVYNDIDWERGYEFLDKELQQVVSDAELGRRLVDKLVKVWRKDGREAWVLIHIEVQGQREVGFSERMYIYNYRIFDKYKRPVASFAVLCDDEPGWRPEEYSYELWGSRAGLHFATVKLVEYEQEWERLEQSNNPFAVVVMAHLKSRATKRDVGERLRWKLSLVKMLYQKEYNREDILELFRFIDWVMRLPQELEDRFEAEIEAFEEEQHMPYVTSIERRAEDKGLQQGKYQGEAALLRRLLARRFGELPEWVESKIDGADTDTLERWGLQLLDAANLEAAFK